MIPGRPDRDLATRLVSVLPKWCPVAPHAKQAAFLMSDARRLLYGGAAGGGKTTAAMMAALQHVDCPDYSALLVRADLVDLKMEGGLIPLAHEWARLRKWHRAGARWSGDEYKWTFPSGAVIQFGYLKDGQADRYLSSEWNLIHIEESTTVAESAIRELQTRHRRRVGSAVPLRFRASSNPGGISHDYWRSEFVDRGLLIPAFLDDNPGIDADEYDETLRDAATADRYAQLRHGRWDVNWKPGAGWDPTDFRFVPDPDLGSLLRVVIGVDPSGSGSSDSDECGIIVAGVLPDGRTVFLADLSERLPPAQWAAKVVDAAGKLGASVSVERNLPGAVEALDAAVANSARWVEVVPVTVRGSKEARHAPLAVRCRAAARRESIVQNDVVFAESLRGGEAVSQCMSWTPAAGRKRHGSPDRIDGMVVADAGCSSLTVV